MLVSVDIGNEPKKYKNIIWYVKYINNAIKQIKTRFAHKSRSLCFDILIALFLQER